MTASDLYRHLEAHGVRLGLRLQIDAPEGAITPEVKEAFVKHKPLVAARVANRLRWDELKTWQWGSGNTGTPPF